MFTTIDKAIAGALVSWIANECLIYFHITLPADVQTALAGLIVGILIWATPNVEKIIEKQTAAPAGGPSSPSAGAKVSALIGLIVLASLLAHPAFAQTRKPLPHPAITGNVINDINTDLHGGTTAQPSIAGVTLTGDITKDGPKIWAAILSANSADLSYAAAMATAAGTPASKTRLQCLNALIAVNAQAAGASLVGADGKPLVKPDPHSISDIESVAELVDNLSPQGALYTSCAGAATMFKTNVLQLINSIVTGVAAFGATGGIIP